MRTWKRSPVGNISSTAPQLIINKSNVNKKQGNYVCTFVNILLLKCTKFNSHYIPSIYRGGIILEKLKNMNFLHMALDRGQNPFAAPFAAPFAQFFFVFLGGKFEYFFEWAERSDASQRVSQPTGAKQPATS